MGAKLSRKKRGDDVKVDQAEATAAGIVEATTETAKEVSAQLADGAAAASQGVSSTLEATAEAAAEVVKEAIAAAESVSEEPKEQEAPVAESQEVTQEAVSTLPVPSEEITSTEPEAKPAAEAPAETVPEPVVEPVVEPEPVTETRVEEPESAPETEGKAEIQSESVALAAPEDTDLPAETIPGLQAEIEAEVTSTATDLAADADLISTSISGAKEAAAPGAGDTETPSEEATVENGDCEIPNSCAGQNSESQEQVSQPAVEQLTEECLNGIGLPADPPKEQTDCELKKDWELPEGIGELGEAVSAGVNQVVDLV